MPQLVVWYGHQISLPIDAAHAAFLPVCRYVQNASRRVTMRGMTLICSSAKQGVLVIVVILR